MTKLFKDLEVNNVFEEWKDMPEFIQEKQEPYQTIIVRFRCEDDVKNFSDRIGQQLTSKSKSIWYPFLVRGINSHKRWKDKS